MTGANSGFGRAVVEAALDAGDAVVAAVRRPDTMAELVERADPGRLDVVRLDIADTDALPAVAQQVLDQVETVDVLVNNAGRGHLGAIEETTDAELRELMELHFFGPAALTRLLIPAMREQGSGAIVQLTSMGGRTTFPGVGGYSASKFALEGWSEALAAEVAPFGIRVIIVEPGAFRTGFNGGALKTSEPLPAYEEQMTALRETFESADGQQPGDPEKAAAAILAALDAEEPPLRLVLGSDAAEMITASLDSQRAELDRWADVARGTDYQGAPASQT